MAILVHNLILMRNFLLVYFILTINILLANEIIVDEKKVEISAQDVAIILDDSKEVSVDSIINKFNSGVNEGNNLKSLNFGFYDGTVWLKLQFSNNSHKVLKRILEFKNPNLDIVEFYELTKDSYQLSGRSGDFYSINERDGKHRFPQFSFVLYPNAKKQFLIRVVNHGDQFYMPLTVWNSHELNERDYFEQYFNGVYYGIVLFVLLLNILIFIIIREKANFYYIFYIAGLIILQLALGGQAYEFLWDDSIYLSNFSLPIFASFSVFFLTKFTQYFLDTKNQLPRLNKLFSLFSWLILGITILSLFYSRTTYKISIIAINAVTFLLNIIIIPTAILLVKRKYKPARFFLLAFLVLIISVFIFIMRNFGIIPSNNFTNYSLNIGSAFEVILLSFAIVDKFKLFKDQAVSSLEEVNELKTLQNIKLENQVKERTQEIQLQKEEILHKNQEILDSINYAKRIQLALITPEEVLKKTVPNSFVFFQPKDIVSGDFYWFAELSTTKEGTDNEHLVVFCVADCTGHGVPGAFMSLIGMKILNQSIKQKDVNSPAEALDFLNAQVYDTMNKHASEDSIVRDGMDAVLFAVNFNKLTLNFAGANNPLFIIRNKEVIELKADKQPIGAYEAQKSFTNNIFQLQKDDMIYATTDGYIDQFGGEDGKKLKSKRFKEKLLECVDLPIEEQKEHLSTFFNSWKGSLEQLDDVCVMGVKI